MKDIKLFITDIDGVWTDGTFFYTEEGYRGKTFHTYDSAGVLFLKLLGIPTAIISGEKSEAVQKRAEKLQIKEVYTGVQDKVFIIEKLLLKHKISWEEIAYIGDDINDLKVFEKAALTACPAQSPSYIKQKVDWVLTKEGGKGVFREFVEKYLNEKGMLEQAIKLFLNQ
jgi:3-deoxy-D-manno-octulosonate 8-phosphate phosphatase (KDO 8-P phosphatase)